MSVLVTEISFDSDEQYYFDREDLPWLQTPAEMQDLWRQRVTNDALSLVLADKTWDETAEILRKRYKRGL